jgi:predicted N-formylglutamate amidohydrolase
MPGPERAVRGLTLVVSCEHGGNRIPARYRSLFARRAGLLNTHRGYDAGALTFARELSAALNAPLFYSTISRLLVELNRSPGHPQLFHYCVPADARKALIARFYRPYRNTLEQHVAAAVDRGERVVHVSCHSFTPLLAGSRRAADIGLLFDPARAAEADLCARWQAEILAASTLRVRRNYPYRGWGDGLTTHLRRRFAQRSYAGIELEINQRFPRGDARRWRALRRLLIAAFSSALAASGGRWSPSSATPTSLRRSSFPNARSRASRRT